MAGQLYLQREAQEGTDQDDDGEYRHARQGGFSGDGADDVPNHQQLQAEQDRPAELLAEAAVNLALVTAEPDGGSTGADHHADDDDSDPGGVDDLPDALNRMVIVHGAPLSVVRS